MLCNKGVEESGRKDVKLNNKIELRPSGGKKEDKSNLIKTEKQEAKERRKIGKEKHTDGCKQSTVRHEEAETRKRSVKE